VKKARLIFCDGPVLKRWVDYQVAQGVGRILAADLETDINRAFQVLESFRTKGLKIACTVATASHVVTTLYKQPPPFSGDISGFPLKKSCARTALGVLRGSVELMAARPEHFKAAEELWFAYCVQGIKEAYAGFADYIDAALIRDESAMVSHVMVGHGHLKYILEKSRCRVNVHRL